MNNNKKRVRQYRYEALMRYAKQLGFGHIHTQLDAHNDLQAFIAIHNTDLGPAIGGCRLYPYDASGPALFDALRLAYMMTLKAAVSDLPHGGAKAVILMPTKKFNREQLFCSYGDFVHQLNGTYITACDVGTTTDDMDIIATRTPYVIGAAKTHKSQSSPGPHTAKGVFLGIKAAVKFKLDRDSLEDVHIAIQGAGSVGRSLCALLAAEGAKITICDPKQEVVEQFAAQHGATVVPISEIYDTRCDVFSPCALGGTINQETLQRIQAPIIAGSANNQLSHPRVADIMLQKNILYAPDYLINSGGLINAAIVYDSQNPVLADHKIDQLYKTLLDVYEKSAQQQCNTLEIVNQIALDRLKQSQQNKRQQFDPLLT